MIILNIAVFKRRNFLTCVLIYSLTKYVLEDIVLKTVVFLKFCNTCWGMSMTKFTVKKVTVFRVATQSGLS